MIPNELKNFDESQRCKICHDYYRNAVSLKKCGHSFCSECIRINFRNGLTGLKRKATCPFCREEYSGFGVESMLIPNRTVQESVHEWKAYLRTTGKLNESKSTRHTITTSLPPHVEEQCPVKKRPPFNYSGLKRKKLVELCEQEGLSTAGKDTQLKERHQHYITFWNSEMDGLVTPKHADILQQYNDRERAKEVELKKDLSTGGAIHTQLMNKLGNSRKRVGEGDAAKITSGNAKFDAKLNDGFSNMIQQLKQKQKKKDGPQNSGVEEANKSETTCNASKTIESDGENILTGSGGESTEIVDGHGEEHHQHQQHLYTSLNEEGNTTTGDEKEEKGKRQQKQGTHGNKVAANRQKACTSSDRSHDDRSSPLRPEETTSRARSQNTLPTESSSSKKRPLEPPDNKQSHYHHQTVQPKQRQLRTPSAWNCKRCTFKNTPGRMICEMCFSPRAAIV